MAQSRSRVVADGGEPTNMNEVYLSLTEQQAALLDTGTCLADTGSTNISLL